MQELEPTWKRTLSVWWLIGICGVPPTGTRYCNIGGFLSNPHWRQVGNFERIRCNRRVGT